MKKLSLTLVLGILLLNVSAFGRSSELNIRLHNYARFNVELDNQVMNNLSSSYDFYNLAPGYHYLKVYSVPVHVYGNRGAYHHTPYIIFAGSVYIGANRKVYAMIDGSQCFISGGQLLIKGVAYHPPSPPG